MHRADRPPAVLVGTLRAARSGGGSCTTLAGKFPPMEILFEILFQVVLWILQLVGEILLQVFGEALAELGLRSLREPFRRPEPVVPWLAGVGYFLFGLMAGGLSLWVFPAMFIQAPWLRATNLVIAPVVAGMVMALIGRYRRNKGQEVIRLDTFLYGFIFAFAMSLVRYVWGH